MIAGHRRYAPQSTKDTGPDGPPKAEHEAATVCPEEILPLPAGPVPRPVRDLWAVHHGLGSGFGESGIGGELDGNVLGFCDGDRPEGLKRTGGTPPDRLVTEVGRGDFHSCVLDLDVLDTAGNPMVATWAWREWDTGGHRQFWDWLDDNGTRLVWL